MSIPASYPDGYAPAYATSGSAGMDLRAHLAAPVVIGPWSREIVPTGVRMAIPEGFEGQVRPRSGLAAKHGITTLNAPGTIDSDYRGEIKVILMNSSSEPFTVAPGDRIAQLVIAPFMRVELVRDTLTDSDRGEGGFGSTGR